MQVSNRFYVIGRQPSVFSENLSCINPTPMRELDVRMFSPPLSPLQESHWRPRSNSLTRATPWKRVKLHHAFETVTEVPEEMEQGSDSMASTTQTTEDETRVTHTEMVAEIERYLATAGSAASDDSSKAMENNIPGHLCRGASGSASPKLPSRPSTLCLRHSEVDPSQQPRSDDFRLLVKFDEPTKPNPKPRPGPPGPPPPYPPPPIPEAIGKAYHGAELYSCQGDVRLRMVSAPKAPVSEPPRTERKHSLLRLSLEEQRWGGAVPRPDSLRRPQPQRSYSNSNLDKCVVGEGDNMASFKYDDAEKIWCSVPRKCHDKALMNVHTFLAASPEAYCEIAEPVSPTSSIPRAFKDSFNSVYAPQTPVEGFAPEWEFPKGVEPESPGGSCTTLEKKPAVLAFFAQPKLGFARLRSVSSLGSLTKTPTISGEDSRAGSHRGGSVSSSSLASVISASSTSPTSQHRRKPRSMEAKDDKASLVRSGFGLASTRFIPPSVSISTSLSSSSPSAVSCTPADTSSSQQKLCERMPKPSVPVAGSRDKKIAFTGSVVVISRPPPPSTKLREVSSAEFLQIARARRELAEKNIIEKEKMKALNDGKSVVVANSKIKGKKAA